MDHVTSTAVQVNGILSKYIAVHNDVFSFSLRRVLPIPGLFQPIRFAEHVQTLAALRVSLESSRSIVQGLARDEAGSDPLVAAFLQYIESLHDTITRLLNVCTHLLRKARR